MFYANDVIAQSVRQKNTKILLANNFVAKIHLFEYNKTQLYMFLLEPLAKKVCSVSFVSRYILHDVFYRFKKYDTLKIFKEPVQLISADETKRIRFNDAAIVELQKVDHDVNVVAVVGLYRTGKSLLLNRLAGINNGNFTHTIPTRGTMANARN